LRPGQRVLEIRPGPGRLLIPAAKQVQPDGEAVGIDIQPAMIERLKARANEVGVTNLQVILGDAASAHIPEASFDLVFLCAALGEIPDRTAALTQCYSALRPGGILSITEMVGDPHYQSRSVVERLAKSVGFCTQSARGGWWLYTADFIKDQRTLPSESLAPKDLLRSFSEERNPPNQRH
jgi:ubiquinone/menaquinone biosynthesis C-methylase UbiE